VHGAGCTPDVFDAQAGAFDAIAPDLHALAPDAMSVAEYARALRPLLDALERPFVLAGSSMGAAVALEIAIEGHARLRALAMLGCAPKLRVAPHLFERMSADFDGFAGELPHALFARRDAAREAAATKMIRRVGAARTLADFRACDAWDLGERGSAVVVPAAVLTGEADVMTPVKFGTLLADRIPGAALRILPGAGHLAMLEDPAETNAALRAFVTAS